MDGADFSDACFNGADINDSTLAGSCLDNTTFHGTRLTDVDFVREFESSDEIQPASMAHTDFEDALLKRVNVEGVDLSSAMNLSAGQLAGMITDAATVLPDGLRNLNS